MKEDLRSFQNYRTFEVRVLSRDLHHATLDIDVTRALIIFNDNFKKSRKDGNYGNRDNWEATIQEGG